MHLRFPSLPSPLPAMGGLALELLEMLRRHECCATAGALARLAGASHAHAYVALSRLARRGAVWRHELGYRLVAWCPAGTQLGAGRNWP